MNQLQVRLGRLARAAIGIGVCCGAPVLASERFYTAEDFSRVEKIDAHVHLHGAADKFMAQGILDRFRVLTINVDYPDFPPIAEQLSAALSLLERYPGRVAFAATFSVANFKSDDWAAQEIQRIRAAVDKGAVGVKLWKNIGMDLRDDNGRYVMPDDPRFEPILGEIQRDGIVLLGHQAEPLNCWLPFERMTVRSDREYFSEHPQYYMHTHPERPSHQRILAARDRMLAAHPMLRFDAVHLASLEWDVKRVAQFLERFPNAVVDMSARTSHLEHQAVKDPQKVRAFFIRYQDRILYGSDEAYGPAEEDAAVKSVHEAWLSDWQFLATGRRLHSAEFPGTFQGMHLPAGVIDKVYRLNAEREFPGGWGRSAATAQ
jgi:predicted TIM-barrel fold metal-dependent hydrolase